MAMDNKLTVLEVSGPFREPREPVFSYDYAVQRVSWSMPHAVRVKVAIAEELDVIKGRLLGQVIGSPGQHLLIARALSRRIADEKLKIAETEGTLSDRRDVVIEPFTGPQAHLFAKLDDWFDRERQALLAEVKTRAGV